MPLSSTGALYWYWYQRFLLKMFSCNPDWNMRQRKWGKITFLLLFSRNQSDKLSQVRTFTDCGWFCGDFAKSPFVRVCERLQMCVGNCTTGFIIRFLIMLHFKCVDVITYSSPAHLHLTNHDSGLAIKIIIIITIILGFILEPTHTKVLQLCRNQVWGYRGKDELHRNPPALDVQTWKRN